ncbi:hypothetical protein AC578_3796 [Pseudocercospora eumusae]|uniref:Uncharacterized protein n=1 Tax=Pseudocercospora eumusae TaxID=321146 RepID=A0A139HFW9_9PEZI|nr:hypothetical protein AC578_3796 [Pseudocercospora eumusae]KXT01261.1 hypothetical protein AC578_3796 [Pseudocercospora eumusae]
MEDNFDAVVVEFERDLSTMPRQEEHVSYFLVIWLGVLLFDLRCHSATVGHTPYYLVPTKPALNTRHAPRPGWYVYSLLSSRYIVTSSNPINAKPRTL